MNTPIDIVYTWVDSTDHAWQKARDNYWLQYQSLLNKHPDANSPNRYRDHGELRYSLRSVHQFAPFVNHIYIVTNCKRPKWLLEHPKITLVPHEEIFPKKEDLPTFNSHAIEANLHRIPNLTEKFIYFNDDFFLGRCVSAEDFFTASGKIKVYPSDYPAPPGNIIPGEDTYNSAWKNTEFLLRKYFSKHTHYQLLHVPSAFTKSLIFEVEKRFPDVFSEVSAHKFRLPSDYTLTNGLIPYYALYNGKGVFDQVITYMAKIGFDLSAIDPEKVKAELNELLEFRYRFFCIADIMAEDNKAVSLALSEFFQSYFPDPAPWELSNNPKKEW